MSEFEKPPEGTFEQHGHGRIYCSCGTLLSDCKCHRSYGIKIKACSFCNQKPIVVLQKSKKRKGKTGKVARRVVSTPSPKVMDIDELNEILDEIKGEKGSK